MSAPVSAAEKVTEAQRLSAFNFAQSEILYKEVLTQKPATSDEDAIKIFEQALLGLGRLYQQQQKASDLANLVKDTRNLLSSFPKAKTTKLVRELLNLFDTIPGIVNLQISVTNSCIEWAVSEHRTFFRQSLQTRLISLYMKKPAYHEALLIINKLLKELKKLDDKLMLVEVQLLESRVYHSIGNAAKARAALTSARTSAASIYTPPSLQAALDLQSGMLHSEDSDFSTAFSYFVEALEGYHSLDDTRMASTALQFMLLCKIMLNAGNEVTNILNSKHAIRYPSSRMYAMKAIASAHTNRSHQEYERALVEYKSLQAYEQSSVGYRNDLRDPFVMRHLLHLYDSMLEQNLVKVIEPFSRVEIAHVAKLVGLDQIEVEQKLSQMILDKVISGVLDQGAKCLVVFEESKRDGAYDSAIETVEKLINVVDGLYTNQASQLV